MRRMLPKVGGSPLLHPERRSPPPPASPATIALRRVISALGFMLFSDRHGAHLALESGLDDHHHVHEQEEHERDERKKVDGPGGLEPAEHVKEEGVRRGDRGRHRQPGQHLQRQRNEDDRAVGALLQQPILGSAGRGPNPQAQVIHQVPPKQAWSKLAATRQEMAPEMAGADPGDKINCAGRNEKSGCQKMQAPPPTVLVKDLVGPDRTDWKTRVGEKRDTLFPSAVLVVSADGQFEKCRCQIVAHLTPVESRVAHQDHEAAEGQR